MWALLLIVAITLIIEFKYLQALFGVIHEIFKIFKR